MSRKGPNVNEIIALANRAAPILDKLGGLRRDPKVKLVREYVHAVRKVERLGVALARAQRMGMESRAGNLAARRDEAIKTADELKSATLSALAECECEAKRIDDVLVKASLVVPREDGVHPLPLAIRDGDDLDVVVSKVDAMLAEDELA